MKRNALLLVVGALAVGLIAAGCGGNDDESSDTGTDSATALTKEQFIQQADALCAEGDQQIDAQSEDFFSGKQEPSPDEIDAFVTEVLVPGVQQQIDGIRALTPPEADQAQVTTFLDTAQEALDKVEADPSLAADEGPNDPFAETQQLGKDLGFKKCAQ